MKLKAKSTFSWILPESSCEEKVILEFKGCESITFNGVEIYDFPALFTLTPAPLYDVSKTPYTVGRTEINPFKRTINFNGEPKRLAPKTFKVLDFLCTCKDNRASKDDMVRIIWETDDVCMNMYCLNNCLYQLRKELTVESGITIDSESIGYLHLIEHT